MTDDHYKRAMAAALEELSALMEERETIDDRRQKVTHRIDALRDAIVGLSTLAGEDPYTTHPELFPNIIPPDTGLTEAVSEVMQSLGNYVSTVDIRDTLSARGFNVRRYKNVLSAVHQILTRLVDSGKVEKHEDEERKLYRWKKQATGVQYVRQSAGGQGVSRGNSGDPPPAEGPGSMPRHEYLRKIVEDEKADLRAKPGAGGDPKPKYAPGQEPGSLSPRTRGTISVPPPKVPKDESTPALIAPTLRRRTNFTLSEEDESKKKEGK